MTFFLNSDGMPEQTAPLFTTSVAAQLSGLHPQTLRQYDRLGLVTPVRVGGRNRLYSMRDITMLREVAELSAQGISLSAVRRILELQEELNMMQELLTQYRQESYSKAIVRWTGTR